MANVLHDGGRYIIFGVSDEPAMIGLQANDKQYSQADIVDILQKPAFSEGNVP